MDNNELVICQGLTKNYGKKTALNNLNLTLGRGQFIGLLGPNGSRQNNDYQAAERSAAADKRLGAH